MITIACVACGFTESHDYHAGADNVWSRGAFHCGRCQSPRVIVTANPLGRIEPQLTRDDAQFLRDIERGILS